MVRDGKGAMLHIAWLEGARPSALGQVVQPLRSTCEVEGLRPVDHGHDEPALRQCSRDPDIAILEELERLVVPAAVRLGYRLECGDAGADEICCVGELEPSTLEGGTVGLSMSRDRRKVGLEDRGYMGGDRDALDHVLGNAAAHRAMRNPSAGHRARPGGACRRA